MTAHDIVICAAGRGSRLGAGRPKALVTLDGESMLSRQLHTIHQMAIPVRTHLVVGYQGDAVAAEGLAVARALDLSLHVAMNPAWETTTTCDSLRLGARGIEGMFVNLDADVLCSAADLEAICDGEGLAVGVCPARTEDAWYVERDEHGRACGFTRAATPWEWSNLARWHRDALPSTPGGFVFEALGPHLPLPVVELDTYEFDTPEDLARCEAWLARRGATACT